MKINEKNLISFAVSKTPIDREGWLNKRGEVNKSFQKRWFVLKGNLLFYFEKRDDKEPIGVIVLEGCSIELAENEDTYAFKLVFHGAGNRTYVFSANSQDEMEDWMKSIASASYDYMKLMVAELQRQLDDITKQEQQHQNNIKNCAVRRSPNLGKKAFSCPHHAGIAPRKNPFDKSKHPSEACANCTSLSTNMIAEVDEPSSDPKQKAYRQKYIFLEIHEYYGQIFRRYFEEYKKQKTEGKLIDFD